MNSQEYWKKRETEAKKHNIQDEEEYNRQIQEIYENMMDEINKEINGFYARYAKKEKITMAEAKRRADQLDIKAYERKAKKYVATKDFSDQANEEMRIYNLTMKVNRLDWKWYPDSMRCRNTSTKSCRSGRSGNSEGRRVFLAHLSWKTGRWCMRLSMHRFRMPPIQNGSGATRGC